MYNHVEDVIASIITRTAHKTDLSRITEFMAMFGDPHLKLRCIHVAGTNGKGSTTNYLRSILEHAGYRVGTFTSPHLEKHQDRIRINDACIPDEVFLAYGNQYDALWQEHGLNMFEIDFFVAVMYFVEQQVDYAVFEVGMGGRLDATNVILPLVSVITNIGMDHMQYLGETKEKIAAEKGGIIKPHVPLVTSEKLDSCLAVFAKQCQKQDTVMIQTKDVEVVSYLPLCFHYKTYRNVILADVGTYQLQNASLVLEVIDCLREKGLAAVSEQDCYAGLQEAVWKGRFEKVSDRPLIYIDGAHNTEGIAALCETLSHYAKPQRIVVAALKDKPLYPMLKQLLQVTDQVILTEFDYPRVFRVAEFDGSLPIQLEPDYLKALASLKHDADVLGVVTGSLYFISIVREYFKKGS